MAHVRAFIFTSESYFRCLSPLERKVLMLRYNADGDIVMSLGDVARTLGISLNQAKVAYIGIHHKAIVWSYWRIYYKASEND